MNVGSFYHPDSAAENSGGFHVHSLRTDTLGPVRVFPFSSDQEGEGDAVAVVSGSPEMVLKNMPAPLLRIQSRCLYGELIQSRDCDCLEQYRESVRLILDDRCGIICHLEQEGRGQGLIHKALAYEYMENNDVDTVDAYSELNYDVDSREYSHVASFLKGLGISRVRLITNNPRKVHALQRSGIEVQRVPVIVGINHWNIHYIETKKKKLNHLIGTEVPDQQVDGTEPDVVSSIPATVTDESAPAIVTSDSRPGTVTRNAKPLKEFTDLNVTVVGGFLMDAFIRTSALPDWGRAVQTEKLVFQPGGKGFNQAVAARRLGANVHVIGAIGSDKFGEQITHDLESYGIDTTGLAVIPGATTPVTIVFSRPGGETSFVGWKNSSQIIVDQALIRERSSLIASADVLLSTLEVSPEGVGAALTIAHDNGCMTVLNPAPPLEKPYYEPSDLPLAKVDLLIPNEWEAWELAGVGEKSHHTVESVASFLVDRLGAAAVCVTRAHHGCLFVRKQPWAFRDYPAFKATSDDTTGASDAFCATLALHLRAGYAIEEAIHQAQAAGAWSVRKQGAAAHMPTKTELDAHREYLEGLKSA